MTVVAERLKEKIIKMGQRMLASGLVVGTWGNISARIPREEKFIITPTATPYQNMTPADLVTMDFAGRQLDGERKPSSEYRLHLAIYCRRPDVAAVVHTHSPYASVLAVNHQPLPPILEELAQVVGGEVPVAPYALAGSEKLAQLAAETLGEKSAVFLANHGLVGVGANLEEAFLVCQVVETTAMIYVHARSTGQPQVVPVQEVRILREKYLTSYRLTEK